MRHKGINLCDVICSRKDLMENYIDDEVVVMSIEKGKYYGIDTTGSNIWEKIKSKIKVMHLIEQLFQEYQVEYSKIEKDVLVFLNKLYREGLITVENIS